ncbi:DUF502 domain-containing protein [Candidatus Neomarinimicrobiota bacterium]
MSIGRKIQRVLIAGILAAIPIYITIQLLLFLFNFVDRILAPVIDRFMTEWMGFYIPGLGLVLMVLILFLLGLFVTNFLGRRMYSFFERLLLKIPIVSPIYTTSKQIVETFSPERRRGFKKVIWVEYPRRGVWSLGFVTGESTSLDGVECYNIFVSTTPNPTSGYLIFAPTAETIESGMTTEEGFKLLISAGIISAEQHKFLIKEPNPE